MKVALLSMALAFVVPLRQSAGRAHTGLVRLEGWVALAQRRALEVRRPWPLFVVLAVVLASCVPRQLAREEARCTRAMNAAGLVSREAVHVAAERCRANMERLRR